MFLDILGLDSICGLLSRCKTLALTSSAPDTFPDSHITVLAKSAFRVYVTMVTQTLLPAQPHVQSSMITFHFQLCAFLGITNRCFVLFTPFTKLNHVLKC